MSKLQLLKPLNPFIITQKFGETAFLQYYKDNGLNLKGHNGLDLASIHGQPIYASHDGDAYYEVDNGQGHGVVIRTREKFDYEDKQAYFKTIYWHMCDGIKEPQFASPIKGTTQSKPKRVKAGDIIGYVNSTGLSTGDHLHFGLKSCRIGEPNNTWYNIKQDNGYYGAIDPMPYMQNSSIQPFLQDMSYMQSNDEIKRLQAFLKQLEYFPSGQETTGYYGKITREAVYRFQKDYVNLTAWENLWNKGDTFGPKSRVAANALLNR